MSETNYKVSLLRFNVLEENLRDIFYVFYKVDYMDMVSMLSTAGIIDMMEPIIKGENSILPMFSFY